MHALLNIAVRAARRAGDTIIRNINRLDSIRVSTKGRNDFVSEVDHLAEQEIIQTVRRSYPDHGFLAEESGRSGDSEFVWIIDPLDGTTNFLHGFPVFAVSVAVQHLGRVEHGVVYDPLRQELFTATRGAGAQLDGRRIRVSQARRLESCLIGTGFPFRGGSESLDAYMPMLRAMIETTEGVRRPGAASLDLAYVAAGRLDGFWPADPGSGRPRGGHDRRRRVAGGRPHRCRQPAHFRCAAGRPEATSAGQPRRGLIA